MANSSPDDHAVTATPTTPCDGTNETALWSSAIGNSAAAPNQTPTAAKQPAVAPPSLTLHIPITPASSSGSNSARQTTSAASAQSLPKREMLRSTTQQSIIRNTHSRTLPAKPHHSRFAGQGNQFKGHTAGVTHSNSRTWIRAAITEREKKYDKWHHLSKTFRIMRFHASPGKPDIFSPFVPQTFDEYLGHLASVEAAKARRTAFLVELKRLDMILKSRGQPKIESKFESGKFTDGRSAVLCEPTIWSNWSAPTAARPQAPWPSDEEMKEEGILRYNSKYGRFLPVPRVPANDTVNWKKRALLVSQDFDDVRRLFDCIDQGLLLEQNNDARYATARRVLELREIVRADLTSNGFWEIKMAEAFNTGLSQDLAKDEADTEVFETAKEMGVRIWLTKGNTDFKAEMLEVFPQELVEIFTLEKENEL